MVHRATGVTSKATSHVLNRRLSWSSLSAWLHAVREQHTVKHVKDCRIIPHTVHHRAGLRVAYCTSKTTTPAQLGSGGLCVNSPSRFRLDLEPSDELVSDYRGGLTALDGIDAFVTGSLGKMRGEKNLALMATRQCGDSRSRFDSAHSLTVSPNRVNHDIPVKDSPRDGHRSTQHSRASFVRIWKTMSGGKAEKLTVPCDRHSAFFQDRDGTHYGHWIIILHCAGVCAALDGDLRLISLPLIYCC